LAKLERWTGLLAVLNIAMIAILWGRPSFSNASRPVRGIANPVLAMEAARNVAEVDAILSDVPSPDREAMRVKEYGGFGWIACSTALLVVMSRMLLPSGAAVAAGLLGALAAICGAIGNLGILRLLDIDLAHTTQTMIDAVRYPSLLKWALLSLSLGLLAIPLLRQQRVGFRIVGAFFTFAALLGMLGLYINNLLAWTGPCMLAGLLGLAILCFRPL
jgi:hypothetical protein